MMSSVPKDKDKVQKRVEARAEVIGSKAANLEELQQIVVSQAQYVEELTGIKMRCEVPQFQPLTHSFIVKHLDKHSPSWLGLWNTFIGSYKAQQVSTKEISEFKPEAIQALEELQKLIINTFREHPISNEEAGKVFLSQLAKTHPEGTLMVRSTTLSEDSASAALPGAFTTETNVAQNLDAISQAIGEVVASYFTPESFMQRLANHLDITQDPFMAVLEQRQIGEKLGGEEDPRNIVLSAVMYTSDAGTKIQIAPGHGQLIVNSEGPVDNFFITREDVVHSEINRKQYRLVASEVMEKGKKKRKLIAKQNAPQLKNEPAISKDIALAITAWGRVIEKHYGRPMDVEFVYNPKENILYLVQARPIPEGDLKLVIPSSIPPSKLPTVKTKAGKGAVIKGA